MKTVPAIFFILLTGHLLVSCNDAQSEKTTLPAKSTKKTSKKRIRVLCAQSVTHAFSQKNKKDEFRITITGDSIHTATARLDIINYKNQKIYTESFPAAQLLNYEISSSATDNEKDAFIRKRVKEFFHEENFKYPAVHTDDKFDSDYSNKKYWEAIKADRSAIGFYYLLGEEDGRSIAWSKKLKKVVLYFTCC